MSEVTELSRSCVITGAASGIGRATAVELANRGWQVVAVDRDRTLLDELKVANAGIHICPGDVTDVSLLEHAANLAERDGPLKGWVNNAAVFPQGRRLDEVAEDEILRSLQINLVAVVHGCAIAARHMLAAGTAGSIVNVSSLQAMQVVRGCSIYATAKAGVEGLTRGTAVDYGPMGIRVNAVAPGTIATERYEREMSS